MKYMKAHRIEMTDYIIRISFTYKKAAFLAEAKNIRNKKGRVNFFESMFVPPVLKVEKKCYEISTYS
ncbi:MAG: hypothetical protein KatS3mg104_2941 [Phycisphaerae bacterium]|nr:MAG: hypothetical protein KatS3mg104_2941 [Phycisphaerae bacterium]